MTKTDNLQEKFTNYIMFSGKKSIALELMEKTFEEIKNK
jgi:ribosomal protein S7